MQSVPRLTKHFTPTNYQLSLDLSRVSDRVFEGTVTINGTLAANQTCLPLHAKDLVITSATIDGKTATWQAGEFDELTLYQNNLAHGRHVVVLGFSGKITDAMHGMYPCYFEHAGSKEELIATQCESHHAREVFPCIDEPEAKATFDVTLTTAPDVTVLGNMPIRSQCHEATRLVTTFERTPQMSSYLLAWVVGKLQRKTARTSGGVEVNVYATHAQSAESLDFALDHAVKTIEFFDDYFGVAYPLPKSDQVALPDFSSGAMENWGLITYRESCLLADPKNTTVAAKQYIATVISHELSHQWFGNLVTMKWWSDLWLNESFATLMEYIAVNAIHPEWNAWLDFATSESIMALRRDAIDGVQSVRVEVNHPDEISSLFDGAIVYAKGARLMRMCREFIGDEAFRQGLKSYFTAFAYKNTEADDLWQHLSQASGLDVGELMNTWISQSGYPVVSVSSRGLNQEQFFIGDHQPSDKLWPIPLLAESPELPPLLETRTLPLTITPGTKLNVGDAAHFITRYDEEYLTALLKREDLADVDRLQLLHEQTLLVRAGQVPSARLINLLERYCNETSEAVWGIMALALGELKKFVEDDEMAELALRKLAGDLATPLCEQLDWSQIDGEPESDTKLRSTILGMMVYSERPEVLAQIDELYTDDLESIDPELRGLVLSSVMRRSTGLALVEKLLTDYRTTASTDLRDDICAGLTSVRQPEQIKCVLKTLTDTMTIRPQDNARWFAYLIRQRYARVATWRWLRDNWGWIEQTFGGDKSYDYYPQYAANGLVTPSQRDEYAKFFAPLRTQPALTRVIDLGLREIDARIELLRRDKLDVVTKLLYPESR